MTEVMHETVPGPLVCAHNGVQRVKLMHVAEGMYGGGPDMSAPPSPAAHGERPVRRV